MNYLCVNYLPVVVSCYIVRVEPLLHDQTTHTGATLVGFNFQHPPFTNCEAKSRNDQLGEE